MLTQSPKLKIMADFRPFEALRYNPEKVKMDETIAPPYDVISPDAQKKLYRRSPFNCVRLILNQEEPSDSEQNNRYTRARDFFEDWQRGGILKKESSPSFYFYSQTFKDPETGARKKRSALLGRLKLEAFKKKIVIPHEKTLAKPRADRRRLLEATQANFSPVFGLYDADRGRIALATEKIASERPLFRAVDDEAVSHELWAVRDPRKIEAIHEALAGRQIYIADGHHRYQTALEYARQRRAREKIPADAETPYDFVLAALVDFKDPGLALLATHRLVLPFRGFDPKKAVDALREFFEVEAFPIEKLTGELKKKSPETQLGLFLKSQESFLLTLRDAPKAARSMPAGKPAVWYALDVALLGHLIFARLWNLPEEKWEETLRFTHSTDEAVGRIKKKDAAAAFLLKAPAVEILKEMGKASEVMPQKSTYFYPKLASGLVFYSHQF